MVFTVGIRQSRHIGQTLPDELRQPPALENCERRGYNSSMEQIETDKPITIWQPTIWRPTNPHDRFSRQTIFRPWFAPDFLKSYGDQLLRELIDLDHLEEAPTTSLTPGLKEVIMDASLTTRLLDAQSMSEVRFFLEHKSRLSLTAVVQLLLEVAMAIHSRWVLSGRPESGFSPPIPLMIVVYNGPEDWEGEIRFQDLFPDLPEELRQYVPQFRVFFINLRKFRYGNLPGRPETRASVESLMRGMDGTFIEHLPGVFTHVAEADLDERLRLDLTHSISSYCTLVAQATSEQIINAISTAFKGKEYLDMIETIKNNIMLEGIEIGEARGIKIGVDKGIKIGVDKGETGKAIEIARNMKNDGVDPSVIAKYTGLTTTEVRQMS